MTFKSSPLFYQSVAVLERGTCNHEKLALEIHQCFALCLAILRGMSHRRPHHLAIIGAGGGSVPLNMIASFPGMTCMDVIDISQEVLQVAQEHFGLEADPIERHLMLF